jgi:hypothetical protein
MSSKVKLPENLGFYGEKCLHCSRYFIIKIDTLKLEAESRSETLVTTGHNQEEYNLNNKICVISKHVQTCLK